MPDSIAFLVYSFFILVTKMLWDPFLRLNLGNKSLQLTFRQQVGECVQKGQNATTNNSLAPQ